MMSQESYPVGSRKRHTACGITCHSITCPGGTPSLAGGGVPHPDLTGGYPIMGYPHLGLGYSQDGAWDQWKYYGVEMRYPLERTWDQWKYYGMEIL